MNDNIYSGRAILKALGVDSVSATMALRQIHLPPRSSDPDAGATIVIVKAVQRGLNKLGVASVNITGLLDERTESALSRVIGKDWISTPWMKITEELVTLHGAGVRVRTDSGMSQLKPLEGVPLVSQLGGILLLGGVAYLAFKHKK